MPPQKAVRTPPSPKAPKSFEETLWDTANPSLHGSMSDKGEGQILQKVVENNLIDVAPQDSVFPQSEAIPQVVREAKDNMIALPGQLFYTTRIPVCHGFQANSKRADRE